MFLKLGILLWIDFFIVETRFYDQYKVFRTEGEMKNQDHSNDNYQDTQIYFQAIKDTFDLYYRDKRYKHGKVCQSDQTHLDIGHKDTIYSKLKSNFNKSCSYVIGNVVIAHISHEDISFLDSIIEISGYLFVFNNTAKSISLRKLEVIRGENPLLLKGKIFAMAITSNYFGPHHLEHIIMPNLQVILRHDVLIFESPGLCYMNKINWDALIEEPQKVLISERNEKSCLVNYNGTARRSCHSNCPKWSDKQFCWSNSSSDCQIINECRNPICSYTSKCYINANKTERCCNDQCAGGCSGPSKSQCLACKNFNNDGFCVEYCPIHIIHKESKQIKNPEGKLAFNNICVDKCPVKFFNESGNCVLNCTNPNTYPVNETCVECPNRICPKVCHMKDILVNKNAPFINRVMLNRLENCTVYDGNIIINMLSFHGDQFHNMSKKEYGIRTSDLKKLESLQEIYGYLEINTGHFGLIYSLLFLKNLRIIRANNVASNKRHGLSITSNNKLLFLGLKSLIQVQNGDIIIRNNRGLCWIQSLNEDSIKHTGKMIISKNNDTCNRDCDILCDKLFGCWGPTNGLCVRCSHYLANRICISNCIKSPGFFYGNASLTEKKEKQCSLCHSQCNAVENTCHGPRNDQCNHGCKKYLHKNACVAECPSNHYGRSSKCIPCNLLCIDVRGNSTFRTCSGSASHVGVGGCRKCNHVVLKVDDQYSVKDQSTCINVSDVCPFGSFRFFIDLTNLDYIGRIPIYLQKNRNTLSYINNWFYNETDYQVGFGSICLPCHPSCLNCTDGSNIACPTCKFFRLQDQCVEQCPPDHFSHPAKSPDDNKLCIRCHEQCDGGCDGPSEYDCFRCKHVKIITNESSNEFQCNMTCGNLYKVIFKSEIVCAEKSRSEQFFSRIQVGIIVIVSSFLVFTALIILISLLINFQRRRKFKKKHIKLNEYIHPQNEALLGVQPNMATLLLITESQLCRGDIIGSGAFGVVYKAIWQPNLDKLDKSNSFLKRNLSKYSKDSSIKLVVAVKVLTDISDTTNNMQLLEEAKVMASVDHTCCLRILGLCLTAHPQLITQFMPLGSLLEFCQKNRQFISNVTLLNWAKQIAYGMEYLESKGIIHCDLAARNVLVQSPKQVKITDFGLAKMLDQSQHQYQSKGGRMPIKWLAIECIKCRIFSFKSDVWSFGVTLWEMFTFGEKPYQNVKAFEILNHLEKGQRLSQPKICSIDVYAIMVQCWLVDSESRPTFSELTKAFEVMVKNPNRYLLIQNSPEIESIYSGFENDALKYDEFLHALVSVPHLNPDYQSLDHNINEKTNIKSVKSRYREMCSYKNSFVNYINEWRDNCSSKNTEYVSGIPETEEFYDQSLNTWSEYSRESKRLSNSTLMTTVNAPVDYTLINQVMRADISDDGYLIPNGSSTPRKKIPFANINTIKESEEKLVFSCGKFPDKEVFIGQESSL